eukprot:IDg2781t1
MLSVCCIAKSGFTVATYLVSVILPRAARSVALWHYRMGPCKTSHISKQVAAHRLLRLENVCLDFPNDDLLYSADTILDLRYLSTRTTDYLMDSGLSLLNWMSRNPDLNPIESLLACFVREAVLSSVSLITKKTSSKLNVLRFEECAKAYEQVSSDFQQLPYLIGAILHFRGELVFGRVEKF